MNEVTLDRNRAEQMLYKMILIRKFENVIGEYKLQKQIYGMAHCCNGQEAVAVGVCMNLNKSDYIISNHRPHGHAIAKGIDLNRMMAEIFGKAVGTNGGKGGSMHVNDRTCGVLAATGIVGSGIPIACGAAFAAKYKHEDRVTCVFFGDGAANEGTLHECLNLASKWELPIVFVLEDNGLAVTTATKDTSACEDYTLLAKVYGIEAFSVNGQAVEDVYSVARIAIEKSRKCQKPVLIQAKTIRFREHAEGQYYINMRDTNYRDIEQLHFAQINKCPIRNYEILLKKNNILDEKDILGIHNDAENKIQECLEFALGASEPEPETAYENVYFGGVR